MTLVTTPIYYVNDKPHIGHAYTSIVADVITRIVRENGNDAFFLTGTDEHGQKVQRAAEKAEKTPLEFCNGVSQAFRDVLPICNIQNDYFVRTTDESHRTFVQQVWKELYDNGWIYKGKYSGWYAVRDEAFYQESELVDGKAPTGADVSWHEEESYFFRLSEFTKPLLEFYKLHPNFVFPYSRIKEVQSFVGQGLTDLSISRASFSWGVKVPGDESHVVYVWLDALFNYVSAVDSKWWSGKVLHLLGKDILRFHAVYWPAFLLARKVKFGDSITMESLKSLCNIEILSTGWWTREGEKMSKSLGNVVDPTEMVEKYGADKFRYFLMKEMSLGQDGDFSEERLITLTNADLCDNFGNLVQRILSFTYKNCDGVVPKPKLSNILLDAVLHWDVLRPQETLKKIMEYSTSVNKFIDESAPWTLRKNGKTEEMQEVLAVCIVAIGKIAHALMPYIPESAFKVLQMIEGEKIAEPQIVFAKL